jgi:hypothetical protein
MPRTKKPAGQAVDRRNGRQYELSAGGDGALPWLELPPRTPAWSEGTLRALAALRADPVARALTPVDEPVILRWLDSMERAQRALRRADRRPLVVGGNGQLAEHPSYQTAKSALAEAAHCEAQLGVGALNRARLGIALTSERASLEDLNDRLRRGDAPKRPDPRVVPGIVEP